MFAGAMQGETAGAPLDVKAYMAQQLAQPHANQAVALDQPSRLQGELRLPVGASLRVNALMLVGKGGSVRLSGHNEIRCNAPVLVESATDLFVAEGATDISVRGCDVTVTGQPGGTLLTATRSARVVETDNHVVNMALFTTHNTGGDASQTTDVTINGNSTELTGARPIGVYLMYVLRGVVANNRFRGTGHGVEWWGGDGNVGWHGADQVTGAGNLTISGNECFDAGGACVWGSMGVNVAVTGNTAEGCGDVCFDTEGGVHNLFTGNVARGCAAGCYSAQMETVDTVFSSNFAYADSHFPTLALVLIKHRNGNPAPHLNLTVTGNTLVCGTLCTAFYSEGEEGLDLSGNTITNGRIVFANYTGSARVTGNRLRFSLALGKDAAIAGPSLANGHTSVIADNVVLNEVAAIDPEASCIAQSWSDDNNTDEMQIVRNQCTGFPTGIFTNTAGHNAGAPHAVWLVQGNLFSRVPAERQVVHKKSSGNESYISDVK